jgi:predicted RNase H-like nuclease (RuvC/YqgF family)
VTVKTFFDPQRVEEMRQRGISPRRQLPAGSSMSEPRTAIQLIEESARLRAEIERLTRENQRLSDELARLRGLAAPTPLREERALDDAAQRFALLELE